MYLTSWQKAGLVLLGMILVPAALYGMWRDITEDPADEAVPPAAELPREVRDAAAQAELEKVEAQLAARQAEQAAMLEFLRASQDNWLQLAGAVEAFSTMCDQAPIVLVEQQLIAPCQDRATAMTELLGQQEMLVQQVARLAPAIAAQPERFDATAVAWFNGMQTDIFREYQASFRTFLEKYQVLLQVMDNPILYESISEMTPERRAELLRYTDQFNAAHQEYRAAGEVLLANMERVRVVLPQ